MCWFHVTQAIKSKIERTNDKQIQGAIHFDIRDIQRSQSESILNKSIQLFNSKYTWSCKEWSIDKRTADKIYKAPKRPLFSIL